MMVRKGRGFPLLRSDSGPENWGRRFPRESAESAARAAVSTPNQEPDPHDDRGSFGRLMANGSWLLKRLRWALWDPAYWMLCSGPVSLWRWMERVYAEHREDYRPSSEPVDGSQLVLEWVGLFLTLNIALGVAQFGMYGKQIGGADADKEVTKNDVGLREWVPPIVCYAVLAALPIGALVGITRARINETVDGSPVSNHAYDQKTVWNAQWFAPLLIFILAASALASLFAAYPGQVRPRIVAINSGTASLRSGGVGSIEDVILTMELKAGLGMEAILHPDLQQYFKIDKVRLQQPGPGEPRFASSPSDDDSRLMFTLNESEESGVFTVVVTLLMREDVDRTTATDERNRHMEDAVKIQATNPS